MPFTNLIKLVYKAFRFSVNRPIQRFNINNRVKNYLGPDTKYFKPAPRAIGSLSSRSGKPIQYPHLEAGGYKSVKDKRLEALARKSTELPNQSASQSRLPKAFSENEIDDAMVRSASNRLDIVKTIIKLAPVNSPCNQIEAASDGPPAENKPHRPLPKLTSLQLSDPASIWVAKNTPPGRLNLNQLQEIMINQLGDQAHWTPKTVAEKYDIKEEYAETIFKYIKQIRIVVSPRLANLLNYVGRNDPNFQSAKHLVYHVDKRLRTDWDKKYDAMFEPTDDLPDEIRDLISEPGGLQVQEKPDVELKRIVRRPEPLRIGPINKASQTSQKLDPPPKRLGGSTE